MEPRTGDLTADTQLAAAISSGDEAALGELVDRYGGIAFSIAMQILGDVGRAEDCVQEAFLNIWRQRGKFDPELGSLRSWLLTAVRNRAIDLVRARRSREARELQLETDISDLSPGPESEVSAEMDRQAVRAALSHLPGEQRRTLELAYFGGFTQVEIAQMMNVPLGTVKGRMRLALEKLASYLRARGVVDV
jgi:RNA polymerase sigma-70 factor (ECF subfamily)